MKPSSKLAQAVKQVIDGRPKNVVSRETGIDKKTLSLYVSRYRTEGDKAFVRRRYSQEMKLAIVNKFLEKKASISLLSAEKGIPVTTIRRWVAAYNVWGKEGLRDHRHRRRDVVAIAATERAANTTLSLLRRSENDFIRRIPETMKTIGAIHNPEFETFLVSLYRNCRYLLAASKKAGNPGDDLDEKDVNAAYGAARLGLRYFTEDAARRDAAESLLEHEEVQFFINAFMTVVISTGVN